MTTEHTQDLSTLIHDAAAWLEALDGIPLEQQFEWIVETFEQPIDDEFLEAVDLGAILIELEPFVLPKVWVRFVRMARERAPVFHTKEVAYLEDTVLAWELFHREDQRLPDTVENWASAAATEPAAFLRAFNQLNFYGQLELALSMAKTGFEAMHAATNLLGQPELALAYVLVMHQAQTIYEAWKAGEDPDLAAMRTLETRVFERHSDFLADRLIPFWTEPFTPPPTRDWSSSTTSASHRLRLLCRFLADLYERTHLPFMVGFSVADGFLGMLSAREHVNPQQFFRFSNRFADEIDTTAIRPYFGTRTSDPSFTAATIWGIPYMADFLRRTSWIDGDTETHLIALSTAFKNQFIAINELALWEYDFVHRWPLAPGLDPEVAFREQEFFKDSVSNEAIRQRYIEEQTALLQHVASLTHAGPNDMPATPKVARSPGQSIPNIPRKTASQQGRASKKSPKKKTKPRKKPKRKS